MIFDYLRKLSYSIKDPIKVFLNANGNMTKYQYICVNLGGSLHEITVLFHSFQ